MQSARELTELRHYFGIKTDLVAAIRASAHDDVDFHLNELAIMQRFTTCDRLRRACRLAISGHGRQIAAIHA